MPISLKDAVKKRTLDRSTIHLALLLSTAFDACFCPGILVDSLKSVHSPGKWKVLVVEENALRILNSVCDLHDLSDVNVQGMSNHTYGSAFPADGKCGSH